MGFGVEQSIHGGAASREGGGSGVVVEEGAFDTFEDGEFVKDGRFEAIEEGVGIGPIAAGELVGDGSGEAGALADGLRESLEILVGPTGGDAKFEFGDEEPESLEFREWVEDSQPLAASSSERGGVFEEKWDVAAEFGREAQESFGIERLLVEIVERRQRDRGVAAAASEAGLTGDVLFEADFDGGFDPSGLVESFGRPVDQIIGVVRDGRVAATQRDTVRSWLELQDIEDGDGMKQGFEFVEPVGTFLDNFENEVDLGVG